MKLHLQKTEIGRDGTDAARRARPQSAIALVITLIMLSVTAFITITFLIMSQRERGAVTVAANETDARLAADTAVQQATARALAKTIALNDPNAYDLFVSTNYINPAGFTPGLPATANQFTNVGYIEATTGLPLNNSEMQQNLTNLLYDPRPPVFVTNTVTGSNEFRFFLNLARKYDQNGNSIFATNGYLPTISTNPAEPFLTLAGAPQGTATPGNTMSNFYVGDPEWIGVLERPDQPHSSSNRFIARYAYIVLPAGKTLDLNYIHNYAKSTGGAGNMTPGVDEFWRDQGVGTWEDNLAAFLTDLNTNYWNPLPIGNANDYNYTTNNAPNQGNAFEDATAILEYRYDTNYNYLLELPPPTGPNAPNAPFVDFYANGPFMTGIVAPTNHFDTGAGFPGADNPTHYFSMQDLFDGTKTSSQFTNRLITAGQDLGSYNRYTFYRLLAQLGTDTAPEHGKINVNYVNVDANGNTVPDMETNYTSWNAIQFFTNVAPRLLTNYFGVPALCNGGTNFVAYGANGSLQFNIEVYPTNYYTPAVHRLLQLAANLYEATTNNEYLDRLSTPVVAAVEPRFPHVYRPIFGTFITNGINGYTNICITNYVEETNVVYETPGYVPPVGPSVQVRDVNDLNPNTNPATGGDSFSILGTQPNDIVYGVPLVVGARKGLPNFNQMAMQNAITVTRKLQFVRGNWPATPITATNVMYNLSISNAAAIQTWNSYTSSYPRNLTVTGSVDVAMSLMTTNFTTSTPFQVYSNHFFAQGYTNLNPSSWTGYPGVNPIYAAQVPYSFQVPLYANNMYYTTTNGYLGYVLTNFTYRQDPFPTNILWSTVFESNLTEGPFPVPRWWYHQNTRVRCMMVDTTVTPNRIVDYVSLSQVENPVDVTYQLQGGQIQFPAFGVGNGSANAEWATNRNTKTFAQINNTGIPTIGILNQLDVNLLGISPGTADWIADMQASYANDVANGANFFLDNFNYNPGAPASTPPPDLTNIFYAPFDPTRTVLQNITWQANDPLVHYTVGDLINTNNVNDPAYMLNKVLTVSPGPLPPLPATTNNVNARYQPWGGNPNNPGSANDYNIAVKDPLIGRSDDWQFPTNKLANVGWIGQVHRGSPWQTVYLKPALGTNGVATWTNWVGDSVLTNLFTVPGNTNAITNAWTNGWNVILSSNAVTQTNVDAALSVPTNDWSLFDLLTAIPNDNASRGQLSVNQTNLAAWSAVMSGVVTLDANTNPVVIEPEALSTNLQSIVEAINGERSTNYNGSFKHLGDVLSAPQLTVSSPYLGNANLGQGTTVNDAMLERIPQQILGLLRGPETRFVVYAYGQSLAPAPRSLTSSGLCQNYQITGETAVRVVIRVDGPVQSPHAVVESFNYLPPNE